MSLVTVAHAAHGAAAHGGPWGHPGFPWLHLLVPIFWLIVIGLLVFMLVRSRRRGHVGPWAAPAGGQPPAQRGPSAEQILSERFARGDIDEVDYRARLEVLRGSSPS